MTNEELKAASIAATFAHEAKMAAKYRSEISIAIAESGASTEAQARATEYLNSVPNKLLDCEARVSVVMEKLIDIINS